MVLIFGVTFLILWQIDAFMRPMMTEQRQTILIGNEHFPLDNSERERLRMALKKCPWGRPTKREESMEKWRVAFAFISHLSRLK